LQYLSFDPSQLHDLLKSPAQARYCALKGRITTWDG
jgi:hypothetical protein